MEQYPVPGSKQELLRFARVQQRLPAMFRRFLPDPRAHRTVVVIPSMSLDPGVLAKIPGVSHYEERMLCMLMLLRLPRARLVFVTSSPIDPAIVDYYLHLLPGIPGRHARGRLTLLSCRDGTPVPLTEKLLRRPRMLERIRAAIPAPEAAHLTCFCVTELERALAVRLDVPVYGCDPGLQVLGSKSGSREVFRAADVAVPDGFEWLRDGQDVVGALVGLKRRNPRLRKAVVKLNDGFSGGGNAVFSYRGLAATPELRQKLRQAFPSKLRFEAPDETWDAYQAKFQAMGGVVECLLEGSQVRSPSVQYRIDPLGTPQVVSTHEQVLGGPSGQVFLGCAFPADPAYRLEIQAAGERVGRVLRERAVLGRFGVDFVSLNNGAGWRHYGVETNLRKGGTTHPFMMLQFLTDGSYDTTSGLYRTPGGQARYYFASDNLHDPRYKGLTADDLINIAVENDLHFHGATQQGVVFHLIGALSEFGKLGMVCVADSPDNARRLYDETVAVLTRETAPAGAPNHKSASPASASPGHDATRK